MEIGVAERLWLRLPSLGGCNAALPPGEPAIQDSAEASVKPEKARTRRNLARSGNIIRWQAEPHLSCSSSLYNCSAESLCPCTPQAYTLHLWDSSFFD